MRRQRLAVVVLVGCAVGALAAAPLLARNAAPPRPIVSVSTLTITSPTIAARESVDVAVFVNAPCGGGVCPTTFTIGLLGQSSTGRVFKTGTVQAERRLVVRTPKPLCVDGETLRVQAAAVSRAGTASSATGASPWLALRCRALTVAEAATRDSFPAANRRTVICGVWAHKDRPGPGPDSVRVRQTPGTLRFAAGYRAPVVTLEKNRYTGRVRVGARIWALSDSTKITPPMPGAGGSDPRCEAARLAFESERSS